MAATDAVHARSPLSRAVMASQDAITARDNEETGEPGSPAGAGRDAPRAPHRPAGGRLPLLKDRAGADEVQGVAGQAVAAREGFRRRLLIQPWGAEAGHE